MLKTKIIYYYGNRENSKCNVYDQRGTSGLIYVMDDLLRMKQLDLGNDSVVADIRVNRAIHENR